MSDHKLITGLPWSQDNPENKRFKRVLLGLLLLAAGLSFWITLTQLPEPEREDLEELPPQLAKILERKEIEPPVTKKPEPLEPELEAEPKPEPEPEIVEKKPEPEKPIEKPKPETKTAKLVKEAQEVAKKSGLLALKNELADLRSSFDMSELQTPKLSTNTTDNPPDLQAIDQKKVLSGSQGIKEVAAVVAQNEKLQRADTTSLQETSAEQALAQAELEAAQGERTRSDESLRLGIEKLKASFYALYNRELRKDPFLEGKVEIEFAVEPGGEVTFCRVVKSELKHKALEAKLCSRMKLANFGAENVARVITTVPFTFQPK